MWHSIGLFIMSLEWVVEIPVLLMLILVFWTMDSVQRIKQKAIGGKG